MFYKPLLYPLLLQVGLTFLVMIRMYQTRLGEMQRKHIDPQDVATRARGRQVLTESAASADNFANLFEMPVLFYTAILLALTLMLQDPVIVALAWMFVLLRAVHSLIHTTYNTVIHRFTAYIMSSIALLGIWVRLGWYIISQ
jgi:hypothetical protein